MTLTFALKVPYLAIFRLELGKAVAMLDFSNFNLSKWNISCKICFLNVWPKLPYSGTFGLEVEKAAVLWYFTLVSWNIFKHIISLKNKNP